MSAIEKDDDLELLDAKQVAELLNVKLSWVQQQPRSRVKDPLPHIKVGKYVRYQEAAVREWLERQKKGYPLRGKR